MGAYLETAESVELGSSSVPARLTEDLIDVLAESAAITDVEDGKLESEFNSLMNSVGGSSGPMLDSALVRAVICCFAASNGSVCARNCINGVPKDSAASEASEELLVMELSGGVVPLGSPKSYLTWPCR